MTDLLSKERLRKLKGWTWCDTDTAPMTDAERDSLIDEALQRREAAEKPFIVTDNMALSFHHALTDGAIGNDDLHDIKVGLRAALHGLTQQPLTSAERERLAAYDRAAKEPVAWMNKVQQWRIIHDTVIENCRKKSEAWIPLFTALSLPVVPDDLSETLYKIANHIVGAKGGLPTEWQDWAEEIETDIRRAAMLQLSGNSEQVSYPEKLPCSVTLNPRLTIGKGCRTSTLLLALRRRAEREAELEAMTPEERKAHSDAIETFQREFLPQAKSPVIPEGWALVPIEPTESMIIDGFESEPNESFSEPDDWEAYQTMSGCEQAGHRARLCWAAMISAATKSGKAS
ncbi:hypothetical protein ABRP57_00295 [Pectobacterium aroidearum]|uniref:hypothetical protein n=1 Tax=Pectobacterium aroidearum TaxID=1201031 RepID=UPI0032EB7C3C